MTIEEAFETLLAQPEAGCCIKGGQLYNLRTRYKQGSQIGHVTFLELLRCNGYIITVEKEDNPERIEKIVTG